MKNMQQMIQKCKQMAQTSYKTINPNFQDPGNGQPAQLKSGDLKGEDYFARDLRNQLQVIEKAGTDVSELQTNYQYSDKDNKSKVTIGYDDNAKKGIEGERTVKQQLDGYNNQLQQAVQGYEEVQTRMPDVKFNKEQILGYQIQPKTKSAMEINAIPANILRDDFGVNQPTQVAPAQDYQGLIQNSQQ